MTSTRGRVPTGYADEIVISEASFRTQHRAIESASEPHTKKRKREEKGDPSVVYGAGAYKGPWARYEEEQPETSSGEDEVSEYEEDGIQPQPAPPSKSGTDYDQSSAEKESTEFLGLEQYDYQGRTYMHVPQDLGIDLRSDPTETKNFVPKKLIHTWHASTGGSAASGGGKAITQMRFFPDSGHLLLSAAADSKVKIWDTYHQRELLRSYSGHSKSVNDIDFRHDGIQFLSASFDRQMKLWDTETGACISRFTTGKTPHVIRFNPSIPHEFLAGTSDKKIVQFDTRSGALVQEYDHHLGPVNTITFCDEDRRFMTTSDDRSLRAWEYGIPVPIKFIAEPYMFSMVRSSPHPKGKYVAYQSSDNQITVYASTERFRQNRKKSFRGHNIAGYAIDVAISPSGDLVMSGDSGGFVCFWDWKSCKMYHKIQASDSPVVACVWQPRTTSRCVTGDLNGLIKLWD